MRNTTSTALFYSDLTLLGAGAGIGFLAAKLLLAPSDAGTTEREALAGAKLQYFNIPALGEPTRLCYALAGLALDDERVGGPTWQALKPTLPFGQMPVLTLRDGTVLTQARAIARRVAKIAVVDGAALYPADAALAGAADEVVDAVMDIQKNMAKTFAMEGEARKAARAGLFGPEGFCTEIMGNVQKLLAAHGDVKYAVADVLTIADVFLFTWLNTMRCGFLDDIPTDYLDGFPGLKAKVATIGAHPKIAAHYATRTEPWAACFKKAN